MKKLIPLGVLLLAACAGPDVVSHTQPPRYLKDAAGVVERTDWSNPRTVELTMVDFAFQPGELTFRRGEPVRLVVHNAGKHDHTFVSDSFFETIAVQKLVTPNETVSGPWIKKVSVEEGATEELWFVPARYGAFRFECTVPGHAMLGMTGVIQVVEQ